MSLQTWEEHAPNHAAFLRHLEKRGSNGRGSESIYRSARRRGFFLFLSLAANAILLSVLVYCVKHHHH